MDAARQIHELLDLRQGAVAIRFQETAPEGMPRISNAEVAGCRYWKLAAEGESFYTEAADHYGCPVGSHTHGIELPGEVAEELEGVIGTMVKLEYLATEEIPQIPQLAGGFGVALYAPLLEAEFEPDVVLLTGTARQIMLLAEAAAAAGVASDGSMVGRPTCAVIPAVIESQSTGTNLGCIGNRVYTELEDDEFYFVIAGSKLQLVSEKLVTIVEANRVLADHHQARLSG